MSKKPRRMPNKTERLAAALLEIKRGEAWLIPEPLRSSGDAKAICAYVTPDHDVPWALTQNNSPQNITHRTRDDHLEKTRKFDTPAFKKLRKARKAQPLTPEQEEARRVLLKIEGREHEIDRPRAKKKGRWPSRPMPGGKTSRWKVRLTKQGRKVELREKD